MHSPKRCCFHRHSAVYSEIQILDKDDDPNWYRAESDGKEGYVPSNYIKMSDHSWFYGKISRMDAASILKTQPEDGAFLVRESEAFRGDFSISVK